MTKTANYWGTGRRKTAVARVQLKPGKGEITRNGAPIELPAAVIEPLVLAGQRDQVDITITTSGGGWQGQLSAIRHGLARAIAKMDPAVRSTMSKAGFLTRDSREKERKKFGLKKARRSPQWSKR